MVRFLRTIYKVVIRLKFTYQTFELFDSLDLVAAKFECHDLGMNSQVLQLLASQIVVRNDDLITKD